MSAAKAVEYFSKFVIVFSQFLWALVTLVVFALVIYAIYYMIRYVYPRVFWFGHTAPYEDYMIGYSRQVFENVRVLAGISKHPLNKPALKFLAAMRPDVGAQQVNGSYMNAPASLFTPQKAYKFYIYMIFREALEEKNERQLSLIKTFIPTTIPYIKALYNKSLSTVEDDKIQLLDKDIYQVTEEFRKAVKQYADSIEKEGLPSKSKKTKEEAASFLAATTLKMHLHDYMSAINLAYDMRKSGGVGNFIMFRVFMKEYVQYVFKETIPNQWKTYGKDLKKSAQWYIGLINSKKVSSYFENLPKTLAGIEGFIPEEIRPPMNEIFGGIFEERPPIEPDVVEHFGFLKGLLSIGKFFENILKVALALVSAVTNPARFFRIVVGFILGLFIGLLYYIVAGLSFFAYIPAFFAVTIFKLYVTIQWTSIFFLIAIIMTILWMLDMLTGGFIMRTLRCENLPHIWHDLANYAYGNKFKRTFMCSYPCNKKYRPQGGLCLKNPRYQPAFCPQQTLYNTWLNEIGAADYGSTLNNRSTNPFIFKPDMLYYSKLKDDDQKDYLAEYYDDKLAYLTRCGKELKTFDRVSMHICANKDHLFDDEDMRKRVGELCYTMYCQYKYDEKKDELVLLRSQDRPAFCPKPQVIEEEAPAPRKRGVLDQQDIFSTLLMTIVAFVIVLIAYALLQQKGRVLTSMKGCF